MKALYFDGTKLDLVDYPEPASGESLVRVKLAGICGTDLEILNGYMSYKGVPGHEFVGVVEKSENESLIGKRVTGQINAGCGKCDFCIKGLERHCPNRTVLGIYKRDGAFAQYLCLPEKNLQLLPDSVVDEQAVFVEPLAAAFEIKEQIQINPNWKIAIVGDGRLAQLVARVLKSTCYDICCFGKHKHKLELLKKLGIKTKKGIENDDQNHYDLVIEATGKNSGFTGSMNLVKPRGVVILKSTIASQDKLDLTQAVVNEVTMVGSRCGPFRPAIKALETGIVSVDDLVDSVYPLEKFKDAFEEAKKPNSLKIFLKP